MTLPRASVLLAAAAALALAAPAPAGAMLPADGVRASAARIILGRMLAPLLTTPAGGDARVRVIACGDRGDCRVRLTGDALVCRATVRTRPAPQDGYTVWLRSLKCSRPTR